MDELGELIKLELPLLNARSDAHRDSKKKIKGNKAKPGLSNGSSAPVGVKMERFFTRALHEQGVDPMDAVQYAQASSKIKDMDGRSVFEMKNVEVPASWSQLAIDILVSKYFRSHGRTVVAIAEWTPRFLSILHEKNLTE